ncbi:FtsW/RodA/SpoVE family cell cycle protein [Clostridium sp. CTA-5]
MENEIIENYLQDVCNYIKNKDVHKEVSDEIREHIYEIIDEYTNAGLKENEAINKAIKRIGSAYECGIKLDKVHKAKPDIISIILALMLAFIGMITMYSIKKNTIGTDISLLNNISGLLIGSIIAIGIYFFDYRKLKKYSYYMYVAAIIILIVSMNINYYYITQVGALYIGHIYVHLIVTILLLISLSGVVNIKSINNKTDLFTVETMGIMPIILYFFAQDITMSLIYLCGINVVFLTSKIKKSLKITLIYTELIVMILGLLAITFNSPYRANLISSIINPSSDPKGIGYFIMKMRTLSFQSTLFGNETNIELLKVPSLESNFVFAYIIYNFGIVFGITCIFVMIAFIVRILNTLSKVKDTYGRTLTLVIGFIFFMQIVINILSNLGVIAVFIGLPFIGHGSVNSIINISMVGLICSIYRRRSLSNIDSLAINIDK